MRCKNFIIYADTETILETVLIDSTETVLKSESEFNILQLCEKSDHHNKKPKTKIQKTYKKHRFAFNMVCF